MREENRYNGQTFWPEEDRQKAQKEDVEKKYRSISLALVAVIVVAVILLMVNLSPQPPLAAAPGPESSTASGPASSTTAAATEPISVWSEWSQWQLTPVEANETCQVEIITRYRSREKQTTISYGEWGEWGEWSTTPQNSSALKDVEERPLHVYDAYYFVCDLCGFRTGRIGVTTLAHSKKIHGPQGTGALTEEDLHKLGSYIVGDGSLDDALSACSISKHNETLYSSVRLEIVDERGDSYVFTFHDKEYGTNSVEPYTTLVQYRARTRDEILNIEYSEWSSYSDEKITASDSVEVQEVTLYRYRTLGP